MCMLHVPLNNKLHLHDKQCLIFTVCRAHCPHGKNGQKETPDQMGDSQEQCVAKTHRKCKMNVLFFPPCYSWCRTNRISQWVHEFLYLKEQQKNPPQGIAFLQQFHPERWLRLINTVSVDAVRWQPCARLLHHVMRKAPKRSRALLIGMKLKNTVRRTSSPGFSSRLLGVDVWKSGKHDREHSHFAAPAVCARNVLNKADVCCKSIQHFMSQPFTILRCQWANQMTAPWRAHVWSKQAPFSYKVIKCRVQGKVFAHFPFSGHFLFLCSPVLWWVYMHLCLPHQMLMMLCLPGTASLQHPLSPSSGPTPSLTGQWVIYCCLQVAQPLYILSPKHASGINFHTMFLDNPLDENVPMGILVLLLAYYCYSVHVPGKKEKRKRKKFPAENTEE